MIEISVKLTNEESKFTKKFVQYEEGITLSKDDPVLNDVVKSAIDNFKAPVDDVFLTIRMAW